MRHATRQVSHQTCGQGGTSPTPPLCHWGRRETMPAEGHRTGGGKPSQATEGTRAAPKARPRWGGALALCLRTGWLAAVRGWADSPQPPEPTSRFRLWRDLQDVFTLTWGGARTAFALPTLTYVLPAAATIGGASFADDEVQAH